MRWRLPEAILVVLEGLLKRVEDGATELRLDVVSGEESEGFGDVLNDVAGIAGYDGLLVC